MLAAYSYVVPFCSLHTWSLLILHFQYRQPGSSRSRTTVNSSTANTSFLTAGPLPPRNSLHPDHPIPKTDALLPRILQLPLRLLRKDRHPALRLRDGSADEHRRGGGRDRAQVGEEVGVREEGDQGGTGEDFECGGQFPWEDVGCYLVSVFCSLSLEASDEKLGNVLIGFLSLYLVLFLTICASRMIYAFDLVDICAFNMDICVYSANTCVSLDTCASDLDICIYSTLLSSSLPLHPSLPRTFTCFHTLLRSSAFFPRRLASNPPSMSTDPESRTNFGPFLSHVGPTYVDPSSSKADELKTIRYGVIGDLERALELEGKDVAAVLIEPIQGEAG